jgi:hypothetical protein
LAEPVRERWSSRLALAGLLVLASAVVWPHLYESSIATDEGVLAQSAERVMRGELPHRDFIALWSGGLDLVHALLFRAFGIRMTVLHAFLGVSWLAALAAFFSVVRRLVTPWGAAAITFAAAIWTVPHLPHPLPSWHAAFLAIGAVAAVARYLTDPRRRWLVAAGLAAGTAVAVKITGLYTVAAIALWIVWQVQEGTVPGRAGGWTYPLVITAGLAGFLALVGVTFAGVASVNAAYHYVVPAVALVALLLWREWRGPRDGDRDRFRRLAALAVPCVAGAALVLGPWLLTYAAQGALRDLARGLFVTPAVRFDVTAFPLPGLTSAALPALALGVLLAGAAYVAQPLRRADRAALWIVFGVLGALTYDGSPIVLVVWYAIRLLTPVCALLTVWWCVTRDGRHALAAGERSLVFLLVAAASVGSLIQIPFALYTYFLYFFPLLLLAVTALLRAQPAMPRDVPMVLVAFLIWFGVRNPESLGGPGTPTRLTTLALPRSGLTVAPADSALYTDLVAAIDRHAPGDWIYVWHDAPEVYFLAAKRNPTPTLFEVFDDPASRRTDVLRARLERHGVRVVVLTPPDGAVRPMAPDFQAWLDTTYAGRERVGTFEVRWRVGAP